MTQEQQCTLHVTLDMHNERIVRMSSRNIWVPVSAQHMTAIAQQAQCPLKPASVKQGRLGVSSLGFCIKPTFREEHVLQGHVETLATNFELLEKRTCSAIGTDVVG